MGWKTLKTRYGIDHSVCLTDQGVCIGSPYIHNIIVISLEGEIVRRYDSQSNEDLARYQAEFDNDLVALRDAIDAADSFEESLPVFTFDHDSGLVVEKQCEKRGWPNCTHDGEMMYENQFFETREEAKEDAINDLRAGIKLYDRRIEETTKELGELNSSLSESKRILAKLKK